MRSLRARDSADLLLAMLIAVLGAALAFGQDSANPLRVLCSLLLVFVLPGYTLTAALFRQTPGFAERLVLSLALSLGCTAVSGLILNWTPWGLQPAARAVLLSTTVMFAGVVALQRHHTYSIPTRFREIGLTMPQGLVLGLAVLLSVAAYSVADHGVATQRTPGFTQLWIVPASSKDLHTVRLGVRNVEGVSMSYRLQLMEGGAVIHSWKAIDLRQGQQWTTTLRVSWQGTMPVTAVLYRAGAPHRAYRHVDLWPQQMGNKG